MMQHRFAPKRRPKRHSYNKLPYQSSVYVRTQRLPFQEKLYDAFGASCCSDEEWGGTIILEETTGDQSITTSHPLLKHTA